jgi:hypothetical protein
LFHSRRGCRPAPCGTPGRTLNLVNSQRDLPIRITVFAPPPGVSFALQTKKRELEQLVVSTGDDLTFACSVTMTDDGSGSDFKGPLVNGERGSRFLYINSGQMAGQKQTPWSRRAKIKLDPVRTIARRLKEGFVLCGSVAGSGKDGGPFCATVDVQWEIEPAVEES